MKIKEIIVVEGKDDTSRVRAAVDCETIETHGFGISRKTWTDLEKAYKSNGLIILTDPDHAGNEIRKRILEKFPDSKEAFVSRRKAEKKGDIGIENSPEDAIREALEKARASIVEKGSSTGKEKEDQVTMLHMEKAGLTGRPESRKMREAVAEKLGIGYGNAKAMLRKMNAFGITTGELDEALRAAGNKKDKE